jgi:streptogramin lyase
MGSFILVRRLLVTLLGAVAIAALSVTPAGAAQATVYKLPDATHASSLAVAPDGTVWFVPSRGYEWQGEGESILGSISPDGAVTEHEVVGFGAITSLAVGSGGEIWIAGAQGEYTARWNLEIGRLSSSGSLQSSYSVGRGGWIRSLRAAGGVAWFVHEPFGGRGPSTVQSVSAAGVVRHIPQQRGCTPRTVAAESDVIAWFTEMCGSPIGGGRGPRRAYVAEVEADGTIARHRLAKEERPASIVVSSDGNVWFGLLHKYPQAGYGYWRIGLITASGVLAEYQLRDGSVYYPFAVLPEGRAWFPSTLARGYLRAINSIGSDGQIGNPTCADPTCALQPSDLTAAPDGSLWYSLRRPNLNTGGGGSGIAIENEISNEAGYVGHLVP